MLDTIHKIHKQKKIISLVNLLLIVVFYVLTLYFIYDHNKNFLYENIDKTLKSCANSIVYILPKDFHQIAKDKNSITKQEDEENIKNLSNYAKSFEIEYLYTMIKQEDKIFFTSSSANDDDYKNDMLTRYFDEYESATDILKNSFKSSDATYETSSDKWGTFRSVFIPITLEDGSKYILGADIRTQYIEDELDKLLYKNITISFVFILFITIILFLRHKIEKKELKFISVIEKSLKKEIDLKTQQLLSSNKKLKQLYVTDRLTNLYNRHKIDNELLNELKKAKKYDETFGILILDIDHFKSINDNYGHIVGDSVLIECAKILQESIRKTDIAARWGGEEFLILCPKIDADGLKTLAQKIRKNFESTKFETEKTQTLSIGCTLYNNDETIETILSRADKALYKAKNGGRNRVEIVI